MVSVSLFSEFISELKNSLFKISVVPKTLIFTSESTKPKIEKMDIINDSFYNIGGLVLQFEEILPFMNKNCFIKQIFFSLDKNVAMDFMQRKNPTEKTVRVLYILKSEISDPKEQILKCN